MVIHDICSLSYDLRLSWWPWRSLYSVENWVRIGICHKLWLILAVKLSPVHGSGAKLAPIDSQFVILDLHSLNILVDAHCIIDRLVMRLLRVLFSLGLVGHILRLHHPLPNRSLAHTVDLSRYTMNHDHSFFASDER